MDNERRVALFIDAENVGAEYADKVIDTARGYGELIIKRIYGGSKTKPIAEWREKCGEYAILSEIRYVYTAKKNASDISLAVDVMNVLHERSVDVFCIASSDSDFTALAHELRERGKLVIGMGMKTANPTYKSALSKPYVELDAANEIVNNASSVNSVIEAVDKKPDNSDALKAIIDAIELLIQEKGKALMATLGNRLRNSKEIDFGAFYDKNKDGNLTDFLLKFDEISARYKKIGKKTDTTLVKKDYTDVPSAAQTAEVSAPQFKPNNAKKPNQSKPTIDGAAKSDGNNKPANNDKRDSRSNNAKGDKQQPKPAEKTEAGNGVDSTAAAESQDANKKKQQFKKRAKK